MVKSSPNPKVDFRFDKEKRWYEEMRLLRMIVLESGLTEELKWGQACYTLNGSNILLIHGFKEYCALLFIKGVLMKDPKGILIQQTTNVQAGRQIRFTNLKEITKLKTVLNVYIKNAIEVERAGLKIIKKDTSKFPMPPEFKKLLDESSRLESAFYELTPGRQHAYLLYFSGAKQPKTREARIEKYVPQILSGKGLDD